MTINEILDKLEQGSFDYPNQKRSLILQVMQYIEKLEEIIKENFGYSEDALYEKVYFKWTGPVMAKEIKEVLGK